MTTETDSSEARPTINPNFNPALADLIHAANFIFRVYGLHEEEANIALCKALVMAIASHAKSGREEACLALMIDYLRDTLPLAINDVASQRMGHPAGHA